MRLLSLGILSVIIPLLLHCSTNVAGGTSSSENTKIAAIVTVNGQPVAEVKVYLRSKEYLSDTTNLSGDRIPDAVTDAGGRFAIDSVYSGEYVIECNDNTLFASMRSFVVESNAGEIVDLGNIQLQKGAVVSGTVLHDKIASADVFVRLYGLEYLQKVDSFGYYHFSNVPAGMLTVNFITKDISVQYKDTAIAVASGDILVIDTIDVPNDYESDSLAITAFLSNQGISEWVWDSLITIVDNRIRYLDLSNKNITVLHSSIKTLTFINNLFLSENNLQELPDEIRQLKWLWHLYLDNNPLQTFPLIIKSMPWLITISINYTGITQLPDTLVTFPNLEAISLKGNELDSIPSQIPKIKTLRFLGFNDNNITYIPDDIFKLDLEVLTLGKNSITYLSPKIGQFKKLFHFTIYDNAIDSIPETISKCVALVSLWAGKNNIKKIPGSFCDLPLLKTVQLPDNQLDLLPLNFGNLSTLKNLNVDNNALAALPASITQIQNIEKVLVGYNHLTDVPEEIEAWLNEHAETNWKDTQNR